MKTMPFLTQRFRIGFSILWLAGGLFSAVPDRPNIVVIIADDLGWEECSPYGHPVVRTPNLQRLAAEGMRFDRFFLTASSCSPSRSSIFSGRYPHSTGTKDLHVDLSPDVPIFVEPLRAAGYHTMLVGKSHGTNHPMVRKKFDHLDLVDWSRPWTMGDMWERALRERPRDRPFLLWAASIDPHRPFRQGVFERPYTPEEVVVPPYYPDIAEVRADLADYYNEITRLDDHIGRVLRLLETEGILDETLIVFLTDNGRAFPHAKTRVNVPGLKSPLLVRYPGLVPGGTVTGALASAVDLAPTLLALAHAAPLPQTDGVSLVPVLRDPQVEVRTVAFAEHNWHSFRAFERAVITTDALYIRNWLPELSLPPPGEVVPTPAYQAMWALYEAGKLTPVQSDSFIAPRPAEELFWWTLDPHCVDNRAADPASTARLAVLREQLREWQRQTGDAFPGLGKLRGDDTDRRTGESFKKRPAGKTQPAGTP